MDAGQGGMPGVPELLEQGEALGRRLGARRAGVDEAAARTLDDRDGLQGQGAGRGRPLEGAHEL